MKKIKYMCLTATALMAAVTVRSLTNTSPAKAGEAKGRILQPDKEVKEVLITPENFPDEYLRKVVAKKDTNQDGVLDDKELSKITKLFIYKYPEPDEVPEGEKYPDYKESDITFDCKGIELLQDVTDIFMNLSAVGIEESGNTAYYEAEIKNLDVIKNLESLKKLEIHGVKLDTFDASVYKNLKKLAISSEHITDINLASNSITNLDLSLNYNQAAVKEMKGLDFSKASKLKSVTLGEVKAANIKFGKKNQTIKKFYWSIYGSRAYAPKKISFKYLTGLTHMGLTGIKIKELDLSKNKKIKELILSKLYCNKITLAKNNSLNWLRWDGSKLKKLNVKNLNPKKLAVLNLYQNKIKTLDLRKYKKLESVTVDKKTKVLLPKGISGKIITRW